MAYQHQQHQDQRRLRIADPSSTQPEVDHPTNNSSLVDLCWDDNDDTKPGIGPKQQEMKVFPLYKPTPPTPPERSNKLFVYGTLLRSCSLNVVVARDGFVGTARTPPNYRMINIGDRFPAVLSGGNVSIVGEVYQVYPRTIDFLDSVEDCPSTFRREIVSLEDGTRAHMYLINRWKTPSREEDIPSGDWIEWKKSERARIKERKERFLAQMAKGKMEAEQRRTEEARRENLSKFLSGGANESDARLAALSNFNRPDDNAMKPTGRLWDPQKREWSTVSGSPTKSVHISNIQMADLRIKLREGGVDPDTMTDATVRIHCMTLYGMWYAVEEALN